MAMLEWSIGKRAGCDPGEMVERSKSYLTPSCFWSIIVQVVGWLCAGNPWRVMCAKKGWDHVATTDDAPRHDLYRFCYPRGSGYRSDAGRRTYQPGRKGPRPRLQRNQFEGST